MKQYILFILLAIACLLLTRQSLSSTDPYAHIRGYCSHAQAIDSTEFITRQQNLAHILSLDSAIYITEPGANGLYFGNISSTSWHLSERPLLLILSPPLQPRNLSHSQNVTTNSVQSSISVLTPEFEATRAKLLSIPASGDVNYIEWPEDANPFQVLADSISSLSDIKTVYVDEMMRAFVWQGLRDAFQNVPIKIASPTIRSLRERKSVAELALLKCANEVSDM